MSDILKANTQVGETKAVTRFAIHNGRFLKGHWLKGDSVFAVDTAYESQYVKASTEFPAVIEVPAGHKIDRGMKPLDVDGEVKEITLKPHYAGAPVVKQVKVAAEPEVIEAKADAKPKRVSDKSPV